MFELIVGAAVVVLGLFIYAAFMAVFYALPVMLLWDWIMPKLFHLQEITLLQSLGLVMLCSLLFKSSSSSSNKK